VNLDPDAITFRMAGEYVDEWVTLDEEELAAASYALLVHESLLVEPAGAAGIAACLRLAAQGRLDGPVVVPLCGGNLHHTTLARIQRFPYRRPDLLRLLELHGRRVADEPVARLFLPAAPGPHAPAARTGSDDLADMIASCGEAIGAALRDLDDFRRYCEASCLPADGGVQESLRAQATAAGERLDRCRAEMRAEPATPERLLLAESVLRWGLSTLAHLRGALEWCSPAYDQSGVSQFFSLGAQDSPGVNYERYETPELKRVELTRETPCSWRPTSTSKAPSSCWGCGTCASPPRRGTTSRR
jgi:hypothetical protein